MLKQKLVDLIRYSFEYMRMFDNGTSTTEAIRCCVMDMLAWQISCFIANGTVEGNDGCDHGDEISPLNMLYHRHPDLTIEDYVENLIKRYGGDMSRWL